MAQCCTPAVRVEAALRHLARIDGHTGTFSQPVKAVHYGDRKKQLSRVAVSGSLHA